MKFFLTAVLFLAAAQAQAQIGFGALIGMRSNQAETDIRNATVNSRTGTHFGVLALFPVVKALEVRTGFIYTQRYSEITNTASGVVSIDYSYFDVPMTLMYRFSEAAGVFGGPVIAFNQSKEVSCSKNTSCAALEVKSVVMPLQVGLNFKFAPQMGGEAFFEYTSGDLSTNVANMRSVGGNFVYYFE
jgi:hypothetical protein